MGLFDFLTKRTSKAQAPSDPNPPAHGWDAIEAAFAELYPGQKARHWAHDGVLRMHDLRNPPENPLDGVSIYDAGGFWHYVGFGLSDLYGKESNDEWSGFGYEFTFRVAKSSDADPPIWPINVMLNLGRAAFAGSVFGQGHAVDMVRALDGPEGASTLTSVLLTWDPGLEQIRNTPHGKLAFVLILGVEDAVRKRALAEGVDRIVNELREQNPNLVTRV